jgi:hypothetical protein
MASGDLVRDPENALAAAAQRTVGTGREYEFAFPLRNPGEGNTDWQRGRAYQIAFLVGPTPRFVGITETTWMSDQVVIRLGHGSAPSIYHPSLGGSSKHP